MGTDRFSRAHPAVSFGFFLAVILLSVILLHPVYLIFSLAGAAVYLVCLKGRRGFWQVLAMVPVFVLFTALSPLLNPLKDAQGGHVVMTVFGRYITWELLGNGAMLSGMFIAMLLWFLCYNQVMTSDKFTALFAPLLPALSLLLVMVLRLVPAYGRKAKQIATARQCIGLGGSGGKQEALRGAMANLSALTAWALEGAIITADSMRSRGYGASKRSNFTPYRFTAPDGILLILMAALTAVTTAAAAAGYAEAEFIPHLYIAGSGTPLGAAGLIGWAVLLLIPTILHFWEDMTWRILRSKI